MIVVQAPLRVSFFGGGTDVPAFYRHHGGGEVLSTTISKGVYVIVQRRFDDLICAHGPERELVECVVDLKHELIREALKLTGLGPGLEITTLADVPGTGTGLGSSSSLTVALLLALHTWKGEGICQRELAEEACHIEIKVLQKPIGKQDQYIAAYGGVRALRFRGSFVDAQPLDASPATIRALGKRLMLFYTGQGRKSADVLAVQNGQIAENATALRQMADQALLGCRLLYADDLDGFGRLLDAAWVLKRGLCDKISNPEIDAVYARARAAGALGGKITGAGGGGFFLVYAPPERQDAVREALPWREMPFALEPAGARVVLDYRRD